MTKHFRYSLFIAVLLIVGCTNSSVEDYDDDDIAVVVRGEEITIKELRFLYPDEKVFEMLEGTIKAKLVVQEAKRMNLDVSDEIRAEIETRESLLTTDTGDSMDKSVQEFTETQSQKLDITQEAYYEEYVKVTSEQNAYMQAYIQENLGEPEDDEGAIEEYNKKANHLLDDLVDKNEDEIEILIK